MVSSKMVEKYSAATPQAPFLIELFYLVITKSEKHSGEAPAGL